MERANSSVEALLEEPVPFSKDPALLPTANNVLHWAADRVTDAEFMAFLGRVERGVGFVFGLHPLVAAGPAPGAGKLEVRQCPEDLKAFFQQLRRCMGRRADLDGCGGELYLCSELPRKVVTRAMLDRARIRLTDGVWPPQCPRVEGRVRYETYGDEIMYRDKAFLFSNFGDHLGPDGVCLDELVGPTELTHVPPTLRLRRFRSVEFIIQALAKLVNARVFPARVRTRAERWRFNADVERLGLAREGGCVPLLDEEEEEEQGGRDEDDDKEKKEERDSAADRAVRAFNEALLQRVCEKGATMSDKEIKLYGRSVRLSPDYFELASGPEYPESIEASFGLNARIQALGFLLRMKSSLRFMSLCLSFLEHEVYVGEAAAYLDGAGALVLDTHWAGDIGYAYAPHQEDITVDGRRVYWHDAMGIGYMAAQAVLHRCINSYVTTGEEEEKAARRIMPAGPTIDEFVRLIGDPKSLDEAVRMLLKSVLLAPVDDDDGPLPTDGVGRDLRMETDGAGGGASFHNKPADEPRKTEGGERGLEEDDEEEDKMMMMDQDKEEEEVVVSVGMMGRQLSAAVSARA